MSALRCVQEQHGNGGEMLTLVIGGSGSGKSEYAQMLACREPGKRYYIATMQPYDEEMLRKIKRHQDMRKEKGFTSIECYRKLSALKLDEVQTILLECMSNLLANEMYSQEERPDGEILKEILDGTEHIRKKCQNCIIVSNDIFSSGEQYEEETLHYMKLLGKINQELAARADQVVEVVCGIPKRHKQPLMRKEFVI